MKSFSLTGLVLLLCGCISAQSIAVDNSGLNSNPVNLVNSHYTGGGVNIFNITSSGNSGQQIGYYTAGNTAAGTTSGVAISTGNVLNAMLPNVSTSAGGNLGTTGATDADVLMLANGQTASDWYILEFDVIPSGNELSLQYLFASEEYGEYVCSNQADVFGIIISGGGITGPFTNNGALISTAPSTSNPSGINSINDGVTGPFGTPGGCSNASPSPYYHANDTTLMEYDGYTDVLTATATVTCEGMYHVRIILMDIGAKDFDSALLLPEKGVFSNGNGTYDEPVMHDSVVVEGCKPYTYVIYNATGFNTQTVNFTYSGSATNGVDYTGLPASAVFTPADTFFTFLIQPLTDALTEGMESVIIDFDLVNPCNVPIHYQIVIYIRDMNPFNVTSFPTDESVCAGTAVTLLVNITGGFPPYAIYWNGMPGNNISVVPSSSTNYVCGVYDLAGCVWTGNFNVTVNPIPIVNAGPDVFLCSGHPQNLGVFIDGGPGATYTWSPGAQLNYTNVAYPTITPVFNQNYNITVTGTGGCTATDNISVIVLPVPIVSAGPDQTIVYEQTSAQLSGTSTGGSPQWTPNYYLTCDNCFLPIANPPQTTTYTFSVTGGNGCTTTDEVMVTVHVPTDVFVPDAFSPNGDGNNDVLYARGYTIHSMKFKVYDMWGQLMFESTNPDYGWDGTVNGVKASVGLYTYTLDAVFVNEAGSVTLAGDINLVR